MTKPLIILHGYHDTSDTFLPLAGFLQKNGIPAQLIHLGDYVSLEDDITVEDLAKAFVSAIQASGLPTTPGAFDLIAHSTGGLVARHWLTRYFLERDDAPGCPVDHLLMLAPANFGSPVAHIGKTMLARYQAEMGGEIGIGEQLLDTLEIGSTHTWDLARRDLFGPRSFYRPDVCKTAVLVGSKPYGKGFRKLIDKPGSDGTVYVCTANMNAAGYTVSFADGGAPAIREWPTARTPVAFGVFPDRTHMEITDPTIGDPGLGEKIVEFLQCQTWGEYESFSARCSELTRRTLPEGPVADNNLHSYQNLVARVRDDLGFAVDDYFLEFHESPRSQGELPPEDLLMETMHNQVIEDVHVFSGDPSSRSLLFDITKMRQHVADQRVLFSLSAVMASRLINYTTGAAAISSPTGAISSGLDISDSSSGFWHPNKSVLVEFVIGRVSKNLFKLKTR